jgi:serine/threonine-protein kinase
MSIDIATPEDVRAELGRILESPVFSQASRLRRFLTYVVDQTLAGDENQLKEYTIGLEVFDRGQDFDPRLDPIVRVEAGRLRQKLLRYYQSEGHESRIRIELPKGAYVPRIEPDRTIRTAGSIVPTLAVLNFTDLSPNRDQLYLCEGMTEELIRALTKVAGLRVFAAQSKNSAKYVLEGGLRRDGTHMRVTAKLKEARNGEFVWAENYDIEFAEVFSVQESISRAIVNALQIQLLHEPPVLAPAATASSIAYRLYLKARYHWNLRTPEGLLEAVRLFEKAIENDPEFGLAYAGLADSYSLLGNYSVLAPMEARHRAKEAAGSAVRLSPGMAEAHTSMAHVLATCEWNWEEAEREYELAIELNPNLSTSHHWYAITCLMPQRRLAEAQLEVSEAAALDPVSISISRDVAVINWAMRDYPAAVERVRHTLALAPNFHESYWVLGLAREQMREYDQAIAAFQRGRAIRPTARLIGALGHGLAMAGRNADAHRVIVELTELSQERYVSPFDIAVIWLGLREVDRAFELLSRAFQDRCYELLWLAVDPRWDALRTDPRYPELAIRA